MLLGYLNWYTYADNQIEHWYSPLEKTSLKDVHMPKTIIKILES